RVRRQDSARRESCRHSSGAANKVRFGHQSHDRQGARAQNSRGVLAARRRGDRIALFAADAIGAKRTCAAAALQLAGALLDPKRTFGFDGDNAMAARRLSLIWRATM